MKCQVRAKCAVAIASWLLLSVTGYAQSGVFERSFPQSRAAIEKTLQDMQTGGRLPVLEGFANPPSADHPLDRYQRGYYQAKFQVKAAPSGGSIVRVNVQVTAWYADTTAGKSSYQLLPSNGRLEGDLLDQLSDQLAALSPRPSSSAEVTAAAKSPKANPPSEPAISAPVPRLPDVRDYSSSRDLSLDAKAVQSGSKKPGDKKEEAKNEGGPLQEEINSLEEVLKNQARPKNLVAVKKSGTPVVSSASLNAKTLFMASAHDEFEMLEFNRDWVHVRISGLSRGWIWRNNVEMPGSVPDTDIPAPVSAVPTAAEIFHVSHEETAPFPGDWEPLRGKSVKIVSVEKTDENGKDSGPQLRLEFAKSVLDKDYAELAQKAQELSGIVLIFDSADGGMIAATFPTLQQWKAGKLSDAALWHQCFFDPPEIFTGSGSAASQ
jgi:hypothetical protein